MMSQFSHALHAFAYNELHDPINLWYLLKLIFHAVKKPDRIHQLEM